MTEAEQGHRPLTRGQLQTAMGYLERRLRRFESRMVAMMVVVAAGWLVAFKLLP